MSYGDFSPSDDPERLVKFCAKRVIPIFPFRFALKTSEAHAATKPTSIGDTGSYHVRKLRQGYVYIFVEGAEEADTGTHKDGVWHVFRHSTADHDTSDTADPERTDVKQKNPNSYCAYLWTEAYGAGEWKQTNDIKNYCWVPASASVIWMAYSEYRWPSEFFKKAHDEAYRSKIMQRINLRSTNDWAEYAIKAKDLVAEYMGDALSDEDRVELEGSCFPFRPETKSLDYANEECSKEGKVWPIMVSLFDAVGDLHELNAQANTDIYASQVYHAQHIYPLSTGFLCEKIEVALRDRSSSFEQFLNSPALRTGWRPVYEKTRDDGQKLEDEVETSVQSILKLVCDDSDHSIGLYVLLAEEASKNGDTVAPFFQSQFVSSSCEVFPVTKFGHEYLIENLNKPHKGPLSGLGFTLFDIISSFRRLWLGTRKLYYERLYKRAYSFDIAFKKLVPALAHDFAHGGKYMSEWSKAMSHGYSLGNGRVFGLAKGLDLNSAVDMLADPSVERKGFFMDGTIQAFDADNNPLPDNTEAERKKLRQNAKGSKVKIKIAAPAAPKVDIPYFVLEADIDVHRTNGNWANKVRNLERGYAAVSVLLSVWSLINISNEAYSGPDRLFEESGMASLVKSKTFRVLTSAAWMFEMVTSLVVAHKFLPTTGATITSKGAEKLFEKLAKRIGPNAAKQLVSALNPGALSYGGSLNAKVFANWGRGFGWASVVLGTVYYATSFESSLAKKDKAASISNAFLLIGCLLFIPGLGITALIFGGLFSLLGAIAGHFAYSDAEDIVRLSFWGSTGGYWNKVDRMDFVEQIEVAKNVTGSTAQDRTHSWEVTPTNSRGRPGPKYTKYTGDLKELYEEEMHRLEELFWHPRVLNEIPGDGNIVITTLAFAEEIQAKDDEATRLADENARIEEAKDKLADLKKERAEEDASRTYHGSAHRSVTKQREREDRSIRSQMVRDDPINTELVKVKVEGLFFPDPRMIPVTGAYSVPQTASYMKIEPISKVYDRDAGQLRITLAESIDAVRVTVTVDGRRTNVHYPKTEKFDDP